MKVYVVTEEDFSQEGLEGAFDVFVGVAATPLDALAIIERAGGASPGGRNESRYVIGKGCGDTYWDRPDYHDENAVTLETHCFRYEWRHGKQVPIINDPGYWSHHTTWHVVEVEMAGFDREAMLEAIKQHDIARGWRVDFDTNHVHAVSNRDEGVARP